MKEDYLQINIKLSEQNLSYMKSVVWELVERARLMNMTEAEVKKVVAVYFKEMIFTN
jgi:hypothetical protein